VLASGTKMSAAPKPENRAHGATNEIAARNTASEPEIDERKFEH